MSINELLERCLAVKNETRRRANTATRIGSLFHDIVSFFNSRQVEIFQIAKAGADGKPDVAEPAHNRIYLVDTVTGNGANIFTEWFYNGKWEMLGSISMDDLRDFTIHPIRTDEISAGSVTTEKLADGSVTLSKLSAGAVDYPVFRLNGYPRQQNPPRNKITDMAGAIPVNSRKTGLIAVFTDMGGGTDWQIYQFTGIIGIDITGNANYDEWLNPDKWRDLNDIANGSVTPQKLSQSYLPLSGGNLTGKTTYEGYEIATLRDTLPDYSAQDQWTGRRWINGKKIFQRTVYRNAGNVNFSNGQGDFLFNVFDDNTYIDEVIRLEWSGVVAGNSISGSPSYVDMTSGGWSLTLMYIKQTDEIQYRKTTAATVANLTVTLFYTTEYGDATTEEPTDEPTTTTTEDPAWMTTTTTEEPTTQAPTTTTTTTPAPITGKAVFRFYDYSQQTPNLSGCNLSVVRADTNTVIFNGLIAETSVEITVLGGESYNYSVSKEGYHSEEATINLPGEMGFIEEIDITMTPVEPETEEPTDQP
jgi:hypothetical protein